MKKLLSFSLFLLVSLFFLFSFKASAFAFTPVCGICSPGTIQAGHPPKYGYSPGGGTTCNDMGVGSQYAQYCSYSTNSSACLDPVPTIPNCTGISINAISPTTLTEGSAVYSVNGSFTDFLSNSSTVFSATVDYGDGLGAQPLILSGMNFSLNHTYANTGNNVVTVTVSDNIGLSLSQTALVTINNVAPTVNSVSVNSPMISVNSSVTATANFYDPGTLDTYTAVWDWGDGTTSQTIATETGNGTGNISSTHTYTQPGVYPIGVKVIDKDNGYGTGSYQFVTVYDPNGSFLTASGTFTSPSGAIVNTPSATGDIKFGVNAKYVRGGSTPNGKIKLDFKGGNFNFDTTSYNWLVIQNNVAYLSGVGTINGSGNYNILLTGFDGSVSNVSDAIRVQITDPQSNTVVYDNEPGSPTYAYPQTPVTKGSVKIH